MSDTWRQKIADYCTKYNIPVLYLPETLYEPKVLPMIRGKAFEYSVMLALQKILPQNEWKITKASINEELGHDTDLKIIHKRTGKVIRVECKLARKEGLRSYKDGHSEVIVKCMRSRTLGAAKVKELAPKLGIAENVLSIHNDQYLPADFDVVATSIGNAFYRTDKKTGLYEWTPKKTEEDFLQKLSAKERENVKDFAFNSIYFARAKDLAVSTNTGITCVRRQCKNKTNCGFIPDNPLIRFDAKTMMPTNGWVPIEKCKALFKRFVVS